jgi:hypothetical protein
LLVCDQPFVDANTIRSLIALRQTTRKDIIASSYANTLGVPALFDGSLFQELLSLGDEAGAKPIVLRNCRRVAKLPFREGKVDIDSWTDWKKVNERSYPERRAESHTSRLIAPSSLSVCTPNMRSLAVHAAQDDKHHLPPKSRRNERKKRPGKVCAFCGILGTCCANGHCAPPWTWHPTVGTLSLGKSMS